MSRSIEEAMAEDRSVVQMQKAGSQALFQFEFRQQGLEDDQAGEGGQSLIHEMDDRHLVDTTVNRSSAQLLCQLIRSIRHRVELIIIPFGYMGMVTENEHQIERFEYSQ